MRTNNLYFGVSQTSYNLGTNLPISAKFGAWSSYNAAGIIFNRWLGSGTLFTNAYIGQAYNNNNSSVGISFDVSDVTSKSAKPIRRMFISPYGNVGIGISNPDEKLTVNGKIKAKEIKVETGWSDFVFKEEYTLPTLEEVEKHIKEKGHLKDIPSAKEVAKNGIFIGEMNAKLLQKIEELTLYTISQEKKIKKLEEENKTLKSLGERLSKIEERLKNQNN